MLSFMLMNKTSNLQPQFETTKNLKILFDHYGQERANY